MVAVPTADNRSLLRQRIVKGGTIAFNNGNYTQHCIVRNISKGGARLRVENGKRIPDAFELTVELDGLVASCSVVWRSGTDIGVNFTSEPTQIAPRQLHVNSDLVPAGEPAPQQPRVSDKAPEDPQNLISILIAEDDPDDQLLLREAFEGVEANSAIEFVYNGEELLTYLERCDGGAVQQLPHLILLDLNMPRMDGRESLRRLKSDPQKRHIPIVVFTTSNNTDDVKNAYDLGASAYVPKPSNFEDLSEVVRTLKAFWNTMAVLPANA